MIFQKVTSLALLLTSVALADTAVVLHPGQVQWIKDQPVACVSAADAIPHCQITDQDSKSYFIDVLDESGKPATRLGPLSALSTANEVFEQLKYDQQCFNQEIIGNPMVLQLGQTTLLGDQSISCEASCNDLPVCHIAQRSNGDIFIDLIDDSNAISKSFGPLDALTGATEQADSLRYNKQCRFPSGL